ncbi:hypothetical protein [Bacilliculturomica massiliensis]|uniref:hypothetical protein n=1 Tax=Bacilliculturomica massiliensis TaxID=1917867 RepID=UPI001030E5CC|nr:hypothetical protein [Bacilliculturomica massiliensis]
MNRDKFEEALKVHTRIGALKEQRKTIAKVSTPFLVTIEDGWGGYAGAKPPNDVAANVQDVLVDWLDSEIAKEEQELDMMLEDKPCT